MKQVLVETRLFTAMPMSLSENTVSERGLPLVEGILATAEVKNGNGRYYSKEMWDREIDKYKVLVKEKRAMGELDHPESTDRKSTRLNSSHSTQSRMPSSA